MFHYCNIHRKNGIENLPFTVPVGREDECRKQNGERRMLHEIRKEENSGTLFEFRE